MKKLFLLVIFLLWSLTGFAANPVVEMKTSMGVIALELDAEKAPKTVANFLQYLREGFYNGTTFHRVIDGFMIQGGGYEAGMREKSARPSIENEATNGLKNVTGSIAMARTSDPHSAAAQFFINVANNQFLDHPGQDGWGYAVFGKVIRGMDVVQKISRVKKNRMDMPLEPVMIESVRLLSETTPPK